jgi:20S proteasome alpha/beta subunit
MTPKTMPLFRVPKVKKGLTWRSTVTIAAGYVGMNGIVLCADTQETIPDYIKGNTDKIRYFFDRGLHVAVTGAGDSELIETIGERIEKALFRDYSPNTFRFTDEVRDIIQQEMSSSFRQYIIPYASFPDRPSCELLILVSVDNDVNNYECLFKARDTTVREIQYEGACVGAGIIIAQSLFERLCTSFMELDELVLAICYVMFQAKKSVIGCGGKTDLIFSASKQHIFGGVSSIDIGLLERQFDSCEETVNHLILDMVNPNCTEELFDQWISHARTDRDRSLKALYGDGSELHKLLRKIKVPEISLSSTLPDTDTSEDQQ